jgi:hypothetical protein
VHDHYTLPCNVLRPPCTHREWRAEAPAVEHGLAGRPVLIDQSAAAAAQPNPSVRGPRQVRLPWHTWHGGLEKDLGESHETGTRAPKEAFSLPAGRSNQSFSSDSANHPSASATWLERRAGSGRQRPGQRRQAWLARPSQPPGCNARCLTARRLGPPRESQDQDSFPADDAAT